MSGSFRVASDLVAVFEKGLEMEDSGDGEVKITGAGVFLLNCGDRKPLIVEISKNTVLRRDKVLFTTVGVATELLDIPGNEKLHVVKSDVNESAVFRTDRPVRIILLGGSREFLVRESSIMATDPGIVLSRGNEGYLEVNGSGKVYLIE